MRGKIVFVGIFLMLLVIYSVYAANLTTSLKVSSIGTVITTTNVSNSTFTLVSKIPSEINVKAIIQPGGSVKDDEVIKAADEHNIAMVLSGVRHFKH